MFKWFEEAFEGVRLELQTLIASMTHQQAMLAELLDSRQAELRLALVAESLPDVVADAVRAAMDAHNDTMAEAYERSHDRFRDDVETVRATTEATVDSLHESFQKMASVIAVHDEEAEQRESMRLGTLKGSVTRQITPIAETLARMSTKLDDLADRVEDSPRPPPCARPRPRQLRAARPGYHGRRPRRWLRPRLRPSRPPRPPPSPGSRPPAPRHPPVRARRRGRRRSRSDPWSPAGSRPTGPRPRPTRPKPIPSPTRCPR